MALAKYIIPYATGFLVLVLAVIVFIWTRSMDAFLSLSGAGAGIMGGSGITHVVTRGELPAAPTDGAAG